MNAAIAERVARGAALLDEKLPGWDGDIDLTRLDLASPCRCVLGQLHYVPDDPEYSYDVGLSALGLGITDEVGNGFNGVVGECDALTAEWTRVILARREAVRS